jgi:DNA repair protein RecN
MLKSLYISSFVIIDKMHVDFYSGMSVLTGETGAGKSIIIDALGQLCGQRSSTSLIKKNASKAIIEGIFDVNITPELEKVCEDLHIEINDELVITKEILSTGKSNVKINYQNSSNSALKIIMPFIIDIHSQFETQKLFEPKNHIMILDEYAGSSLTALYDEYTKVYDQYKETQRHLAKVIEDDMSDEQLDFLESQLNEINEITYNDNEVDELESELKTMQNFEKINEYFQEFNQKMNASSGVLPLLKDSLYDLNQMNEFNGFEESCENIYNLYYNLIDEYENVKNIFEEYHFDEYRFQELQETLFQINRLKRKYGFTMERISEYKEELSQRIDHIHHREEYIDELEKKMKNYKDNAYHLASKMHHIRYEKAKDFEKRVGEELHSLYMDKAIFKIHFEEGELTHGGFDKINFMISVNNGQDLTMLNESASGGEISRIMLAIKTIILEYNSIDTIIFDEVDTGVSGKIASSIGEKMSRVSQDKQVICITHLPQVACLAQHHYNIEKEDVLNDTISSIKYLETTERIYEIAKMLSGEQLTQEAIDNAKKLLNV